MGQQTDRVLRQPISTQVLSAIAQVSGLTQDAVWQSVPPRITEGVAKLSAMFNRGEVTTGQPYLDDPSLRAAYVTYFLPVNLVKVHMLLDEAAPGIHLANGQVFRVLDVGGGPGTGALALLDWVGARERHRRPALDCTVIDHSRKALELCEQLWRGLLSQYSDDVRALLHSMECNLERRLPSNLQGPISHAPYDLILVQNLLSELYRGEPDAIEQRTHLVAQLLTHLSPEGTVIIIEPALRASSRELHLVRDRLLQLGPATVYSPCLHERPCPALVKPDDWCHEERAWRRPEWIEQIDRAVGFIKDALKFSYLILRKDGKTLVPRSTDLHRVVSELRVMKGEKRVWWCDETGRPEVGRLDREQSATNSSFDAWHRGAIVRVSEIVRKERKGRPGTVGRIPSSATVEIVRPV